MCGVLFISSSTIEHYIELLGREVDGIRRRGPDATSIYQRGRYLFGHFLLSMTGEHCFQPRVEGETVTLFNGEIYNYADFDSTDEIRTFSNMEWEAAEIRARLEAINGEYAAIIYSDVRGELIVSTDSFGTKPVWIGYSEETDDWGVCSYPNLLVALGLNRVAKFRAGQAVIFNAKTGNIVRTMHHGGLDLKQHKTSYDSWFIAFEEAVRLRVKSRHGGIIPLSSGYDSGCIAAACLRIGANMKYLTIRAEENTEVLQKRFDLLKNNMIFLSPTLKEGSYHQSLLHQNVPDFSYSRYIPHALNLMSEDPGAIGLSIICKYSQENLGARIVLSGQGADEIYSDYGFNKVKYSKSSFLAGHFPDDIASVFPWPNLYGGVNECYLLKDEYVTGCHSMEGRYPFLDKNVVQESFWLTAELKNRRYKAPIAEYLDCTEFPYCENEKKGFNALVGAV